MRKRIFGRKLARTTNERKQLMRNLYAALVTYGYLVTSVSKAKAVRSSFEKLITTSKNNDLSAFRRVVKETGNVKIAKKFMELGSLFQKRPGGYTRIIHLGDQKGDNTLNVRLELVEQLVKPEILTNKKVAEVKSEKELVAAKKETKLVKIKEKHKVLPKERKTKKIDNKRLTKPKVKK